MFSGALKLFDDAILSDVESIFDIFHEPDGTATKASLKYVPPILQMELAETVKETMSESITDWGIYAAKAVSAFKLIDGQNVALGKLGFALLKNSKNQRKILLYRTKQDILSTMCIQKETQLFHQSSYLQFTDDLNVFWSILFENNEINLVIGEIKENLISPESSGVLLINQKFGYEKDEENVKTLQKNPSTEENSFDESLKNTKSKILSRMAKMGQPLPKLGSKATQISDSSDIELITKLTSKPISGVCKERCLMVAAPPSVVQQSVVTSIPMAEMPCNPSVLQDTQYMNILFADNRAQNTEMRMALSKLESRIDRVLDKIDIDSNTHRNNKNQDVILELDDKILELKKENRFLRQQLNNRIVVEEKHSGVDIAQDAKLIDSFNLKDTNSGNALLFYKLLIKQLETNISTLENTISSLRKSVTILEDHNDPFEVSIKGNSDSSDDRIKLLSIKISELEAQLNSLENEKVQMIVQIQDLQNIPKPNVNDIVKSIMNNLYEQLTIKFDNEKNNYSKNHILRVCANCIKEQTNNVINTKK